SHTARIFYYIFFFQAEDGIRDLYVTGVQTCALPIFSREKRGGLEGGRPSSGAVEGCARRRTATFGAAALFSRDRSACSGRCHPRSEERRVGKECRSLWSPDS